MSEWWLFILLVVWTSWAWDQKTKADKRTLELEQQEKILNDIKKGLTEKEEKLTKENHAYKVELDKRIKFNEDLISSFRSSFTRPPMACHTTR